MEPSSRHVPEDPPPPGFETHVKGWLGVFLPLLTDQDLSTDSRASLNDRLRLLRRLEQDLRPLQWMAQSIWEKAGRAERYDLDELYGMVWPTGDIAMIPPSEIEERSNTRSKLDDLLSRTMDINKVMDELSMMIQKPAITARVNRVAVRLERSSWVVVIGIDDYKGQQQLKSAVADAVAITEYFINHLSVPPGNITKLLARHGDEESVRSSADYPTRKNILSKLWSLHQDPRIRYGDTIVIFYAGHGSSYNIRRLCFKKSGRNRINVEEVRETLNPSGPLMDAIAPVDRGEEDSDPDYIGTRVPDICDRELNAIFTLTRQKKGPNIVFIADCCYSASIARDASASVKYRALPSSGGDQVERMLSRGQCNIDAWANASQGELGNITDVNWTPDLNSFVMLAACRRDQTAKELDTQPNGLFTGLLLDILGSEKVDENTTFEGAIQLVAEQLKAWQEPVAHGERKGSRLWFRGE